MKIKYFILCILGLFLLNIVITLIPQNGNQTYKVTRVDQDTVFRYDQYGKILRRFHDDITATRYAIHLSGDIDNDAEIYFRLKNSKDKHYSIIIPKGKIDTTYRGDYYERSANIVYDHKSVKKGHLSINFGFNWN